MRCLSVPRVLPCQLSNTKSETTEHAGHTRVRVSADHDLTGQGAILTTALWQRLKLRPSESHDKHDVLFCGKLCGVVPNLRLSRQTHSRFGDSTLMRKVR